MRNAKEFYIMIQSAIRKTPKSNIKGSENYFSIYGNERAVKNSKRIKESILKKSDALSFGQILA